MKTGEQASRDVHDREKDLWSAINDYRDDGDDADRRRVQHFLDLYSSAVEVAALVEANALQRWRREAGR